VLDTVESSSIPAGLENPGKAAIDDEGMSTALPQFRLIGVAPLTACELREDDGVGNGG